MESVRFTLTAPADAAGYVESRLLARFDGFTGFPARGGWHGSSEPVMVYAVDVPEGQAYEPALELARIAANVARIYEQESVYLTASGAGFHRTELVGRIAHTSAVAAGLAGTVDWEGHYAGEAVAR